jgi:hypothetical protein
LPKINDLLLTKNCNYDEKGYDVVGNNFIAIRGCVSPKGVGIF